MIGKRKDWLCVLFIGVVLLFFFGGAVFSGRLYIPGDYLRSDTLNQNLPFKHTLWQALKEGRFPLWTDQISGGFPLLAEGQAGVFYPPNFLLFLLLPFVHAYNLALFFNFLVAAGGMFLLARSFKLRPLSALFSALSFGLSSFFVLHLTHHSIISVACWLPLLFLSLKKFLAAGDLRYLLGAAGIIAATVFAGAPQITFYLLFLTFISFLLAPQSADFGRKKLVACYAGAVLLGLLLAAVQFLPTWELVSNSTRAVGVGRAALDSLPYHPRNLATFFFPYIFGDPGLGTYPRFGGSWGMFWENTAYLGLLPLLLALLTLRLVKQRSQVRWLWQIFLLSILLALGKYGPLFGVFYLPGFNSFRVTARFLLFAIFSLSLLSGFGVEFLVGKIKKDSLLVPLRVGLLAILLVDLFWFGYRYNPTFEAASVLEKPEVVEFLEGRVGGGRVFSVGARLTYDEINAGGWRNNPEAILNHRNALDPSVNMLWGVKNIAGYSGLFLQRAKAFEGLVGSGLSLQSGVVAVSEKSLQLLGLASTKYLISSFVLAAPDLEFLSEFGSGGVTYKVYENTLFLPRGILVGKTSFGNLPQVFARLAAAEFDPADELLLETMALRPAGEEVTGEEEGAVRLIREDAHRIEFAVTTAVPQWLFVSDTYYPGWKAYIGGKEVPISVANGAFRAVSVPAGASVVKFIYKPGAFVLGAAISGVTLLSIILLLVIRRRRTA